MSRQTPLISDRALRDIVRTILITACLLVVLEILASPLLAWRLDWYQTHRQHKFDPVLLKAYPGKTSEEILQTRIAMDLEEVYEPWLNVRFPDVSGPYVNTSGLLRKSLAPDSPGPLKYYFFGGSTTFGINVEDRETLPSHFQELSNRSKAPIQVLNYGQPHYGSASESVLLHLLLMQGHRPDVAIFLDGLNDTENQSSSFYRYPALSDISAELMQVHKKFPAGVGAIQLLLSRLNLFQLIQSMNDQNAKFMTSRTSRGESSARFNHFSTPPQGVSAGDFEKKIVQNYFENIEVSRSLCEQFHIRCYFFWQPVPMYNYKNKPNDPICQRRDSPSLVAIYDMMRARQKPNKREYFLADLINDYSGQPFVDATHYSSGMNELIAEKMIETMDSASDNKK